MKYYIFIFYIVLTSLFSSCSSDTNRPNMAKPIALGRMNDITVIADNDDWKGMAGDTFRYYFESAYPIMPSPEPMFNLRHFNVQQINNEPLRKELRTYVVLADLSQEDSPSTKLLKKDIGNERFQKALTDENFVTLVGKDRWARGQVVFYLFGKNQQALAKAINTKFSSIANRVRTHDDKLLEASIYSVKREHLGIIENIKNKFGLDMRVSGDFKTVIDEQENENILWIRKDDNNSISNIVIREFNYDTTIQLSLDSIIAYRDDFGKRFISGPTEGSYMESNPTDLPVYDYTIDIDSMYTKEYRGIWQMTEDYMGGPFVSFALVNKAKRKLYFIDTFVYAPGKKNKRDLVQQLEYIVKHTKVLK